MTLFVPAGSRGFISLDNGAVTLSNIVIPVAESPNPWPAITAAARIVQQLQSSSGTFTLLHMGATNPVDSSRCPAVPGWTWQQENRRCGITKGISEVANEVNADLMVMSTAGRHGFLDALRGSQSERVLRQTPCPLLAIPESA